MRPMDVHNDASSQAARGILQFGRERMTFRLQRLNRLSLFPYFVLRDVTDPKKHIATQMRLGNDQNL